jgi:hypothetical protein
MIKTLIFLELVFVLIMAVGQFNDPAGAPAAVSLDQRPRTQDTGESALATRLSLATLTGHSVP